MEKRGPGRPPLPITEKDVDMLKERFVEHFTYQEIAKKHRTSRQNVQQKIHRVVDKMWDQIHP